MSEDQIMQALEEALDSIEFRLDAASVDYWTGDTPNTNQYEIYYDEGERVATLTADIDEDGVARVWGEITTADGDCVDADLTPNEVAHRIIH